MEHPRTSPRNEAADAGDDHTAWAGSAVEGAPHRPSLAQRMRERGGTPWTIGQAPAGTANPEPAAHHAALAGEPLVGESVHGEPVARRQLDHAPIDLAAYLLDPPPSAAEVAQAERRRQLVRRGSIVCAAILVIVLVAPWPRGAASDPAADAGSLVEPAGGDQAAQAVSGAQVANVPARRVDMPGSAVRADRAAAAAAAARRAAARRARAAVLHARRRRHAAARGAAAASGGDSGAPPPPAALAPRPPSGGHDEPAAQAAPAPVPVHAAPAPAEPAPPVGGGAESAGPGGPSSSSGARPVASAPDGGALSPVV